MIQKVYCREAVYREEYIVDIPDNIPEEEWERYVVEELDVLNRVPSETAFSDYLDGAYFA